MAVSQGGWTPLHLAAYYGHTEVVTVLVDKGADKEATDKVSAPPVVLGEGWGAGSGLGCDGLCQRFQDGKTPLLKGFKSKKGKDFSAAIRLDEEGRTRFEFEPRKERSEDWRSAPVRPHDPAGMRCRRCAHGRVITGRSAWGCDQWREGCELRIPFRLGERQISAEDAVSLLLDGRAGELSLDAGVAAISPAPTQTESSPD